MSGPADAPVPPGSAARHDVAARLRRLLAEGALELPVPGRGATAGRHRALAAIARSGDGSLARLAEGHADAAAICAEADRPVAAGCLYGVWASAVGDGVRYDAAAGRLWGDKPFCSGLGVVDRALVTAGDARGRSWLLEVAVPDGSASARFDRSGWATAALAASATGSVRFEAHPVLGPPLGGPGWYLARPGFWHGACGPAAMWAGLAVALIDAVAARVDGDAHHRAHLGALRSIGWTLAAAFDAAGRQIDDEPDDVDAARYRALCLRHLVEALAGQVLDRAGRACGPRLFTADAAAAALAADLQLYLRQHHAERDDEALGRLAAQPGVPW